MTGSTNKLGSREKKMAHRLVGALLAVGLATATTPPGIAADQVPVRNEEAKLLASDGEADDWFGGSVGVAAATIVIGATNDDDQGEDSGAVYVFERDETGLWVETAKLLASDGESGALFGEEVTIDLDTIAVGAEFRDEVGEDSGAVYVFERDEAGLWTEVAQLLASDTDSEDAFGSSVAAYGDRLAVGAEFRDDLGFQSGAAYVFERDEAGAWVEVAKLLASDGEASDAFGADVAMDGDTIIVGARGDDDRGSAAGAVYVFERGTDGDWVETAKLLASDGEQGDIFGTRVAIDEPILAIGATGESDQALGAGAAYIFERTADGAWAETAKLPSPDGTLFDSFGLVAVSGETVIVGAVGIRFGSADLFTPDLSGDWVHRARLLPSDAGELDQYGIDVAIDNDTVVVGARLDDDLGVDSGSAYVFSLEGCILEIRLASRAVRAGEELRMGLYLRHNRAETVTVPFRLWVEDPAGAVIASKTTAPIAFRHGHTLQRELTMRIPEGSPSGRYRILVGIDRMQQGVAGAVEPFLVVE